MERLARVGLSRLGAEGALVALLGADRRTFHAGTLSPSWMAHDSGVLVRSGLLSSAIEHGGLFVLNDASHPALDANARALLSELQVRSLVVATMIRADGTVMGALVAVSASPRTWDAAEQILLQDIAELGSTELQLRVALAEREVREQRLRHDSQHDPLTGLPNRAVFLKRLGDATLRARRGVDGLFAVLFLDLDDFKLVNDSMGHHVGDEVLVQIARRLEACLRGGDIVARLGGDEFAILLERVTDARETAMVAERVQEAIQAPMIISGYDWTATASIGVVLSSSANEQPEYLLRSADMAMYRAKHQGRARYELYDRGQHAQALSRLQTESDLRRAVEREEFVLHYQPLISMSTGAIVGVEALVRWQHFERGLIPPNNFIPVAEETGLIVQIGRWVLRNAIQDMGRLEQDGAAPPDFTLAVNLSAREFSQIDLVRTVADALSASRLAPSRLHLEITESVIFSQQILAMDMVAELKALGVRIHIDDFGTGYSSLSYLQRLPVDAIKIDRSFVRAIEVESRSRHVVQSLVSLARGIGLHAIAEGVSSAGQLEMLRGMQCTYGQGFFFSKPVARDELATLLRRECTW
jgi:diguanylate cyclase (GGDEF)-like protein